MTLLQGHMPGAGRRVAKRQQTPANLQPYRAVGARAFSLLDLLVSIGVMAVLMGLMLPVLSRVTETTRRVTCRSNVRQLGLGLAMHAEEHKDRLPSSVYSSVPAWGSFLPQEMTALHLAYNGEQWDGLGFLFSREYLPTPEIFYCPSHKGMHPFSAYEDRWAVRAGDILGNYHFRALTPSQNYLHGMHPRTALVADGMREASDFNHKGGCNLLRADMSVEWFNDQANTLLGLIPAAASAPDSDMRIARAWWTLETGSPRDFPAQPWANPGANGNTPPIGAGVP